MAQIITDGYETPVRFLPITVREELCQLLEDGDKWEELAVMMGYEISTIDNLKKESVGRQDRNDPVDDLIELWGYGNNTIEELYRLLFRMENYEGMQLLQDYINVNPNRTQHITSDDSNSKDLKIEPQNFNQIQIPRPNDKKIVNNQIDKDMGLNKQLNGPPHPSTATVSIEANNTIVPYQNIPSLPQPAADVSGINNENKLLNYITVPQIQYKDLRFATNCWDNNYLLGKGGFGTVYKGKWMNTLVAIKKLEQRGPDRKDSGSTKLRQLQAELEILHSHRHDNILPLYGYCMEPEGFCLVYQYMANGSLADKLFPKLEKQVQPLSWAERHNIAMGTARGLNFLHTVGQRGLIHGDIKAANILLNKSLEPKIGDFGLALEGPKKDSIKVSTIQGTRPYLPPEYLKQRELSTKVDTYSFGILLYELATGKAAFDKQRSPPQFLKAIIESHEDKYLDDLKADHAGTQNESVYRNLIELGKWCSNDLARSRPAMAMVYKKFNESLILAVIPH